MRKYMRRTYCVARIHSKAQTVRLRRNILRFTKTLVRVSPEIFRRLATDAGDGVRAGVA